MSASHSIVVAGSTGSVGRRCVYFALKHNSVASVTALLRGSPKDAAFFGLNADDPADVRAFETKLKQQVVDYSSDEQLKDICKGHTGGISCIGVYTDAVRDVEDFKRKEYVPNLAVAKAAAGVGIKRWGYLSGQGVVQPKPTVKSPSFLTPLFSFVKGSTERDIAAVEGFEGTTSVRPGMILNRGNRYPGFKGWIEGCVNNWKWVESSRFAVQTDDIAKALVQSVTRAEAVPLNEILENQDIKKRAREFEAAAT